MRNFEGNPLFYSRGQKMCSVQDEILRILGFAGRVVTVATIRLCLESMKATINKREMNGLCSNTTLLCVCAQSLSRVRLFCDPMDCSPPGPSVHGISLARIWAWVAISSSRRFSQPRDRTHMSCVSCIGRRILYLLATQEALITWSMDTKISISNNYPMTR